ncbi:hypothetical protein Tco_0110773 [Tanacetum coccineum]
MMSKKMAELKDDFHKFKAYTERRFVSLDKSIRAYRLEEEKKTRDMKNGFEVGTDEENNSDIVFNDVGGIVYGKGNDTWADAGLKHGSYFLLDRIPEDGWYFCDKLRLSKEPLCRSNLELGRKVCGTKWVNIVKLKGRSVWDIDIDKNDSWFWNNLMSLRDKVRPHFIHRIGNGQEITIWYDTWHERGPLRNIISRSSIYEANLQSQMKVAEIIHNGEWKWPSGWIDKYP